MMDSIVAFLIGVVLIYIGFLNTKGNISSLHSYHRKRVAEEDKEIFGKKVGIGTIICGVGLVINGIFMTLAHFTKIQFLLTVAEGIMLVALFVGLGITLTAIIKYNKGLF